MLIHFRHLMPFYFHKGKNAVQRAKKTCAVYGDGVIDKSTIRKCLAIGSEAKILIWKTECSNSAVDVDDNQLETLIKNNSGHMTEYRNATSHIWHLKAFGYVNHCNVLVVHDLTGKMSQTAFPSWSRVVFTKATIMKDLVTLELTTDYLCVPFVDHYS